MTGERPSTSPPDWLRALGVRSEMGAAVAAFDWASTPLGPAATWSRALRTAVALCLSTRFPMLVVWGDDLVKIYNDGYKEILGAKHPAALGAATRDVWPEIWDQIGPMFENVMTTGEATWSEHQLLEVNRDGFAEQCWFTFSYSPVVDDDDRIGGVLDTVSETTAQVLNQRRLGCIADLASSLVDDLSLEDVCTRAAQALGRWPGDVVRAEVEVLVGEDVLLSAASRPPASSAPVPGLVRELALDGGRQAVLRVELNERLRQDSSYREFVAVCAKTIRSALTAAVRRADELGELRHITETLQVAMRKPAWPLPSVGTRYVPAAGQLSVGGDWYDVLVLEDGREILMVGDCVGHGLHAAAIMGQLRVAARALALEGQGPAALLSALDRFAPSIDADCTTLACAVFDPRTSELVHSSAGHLPALVVGPSSSHWLEGGRGAPLGVNQAPRREIRTVLEAGHALVLYTDGLVERRGEHIDTGLDRLRAAADDLGPGTGPAAAQQLADALTERFVTGALEDDVIVLVHRR